jgi:hypothetical protein
MPIKECSEEGKSGKKVTLGVVEKVLNGLREN